MKPTLLCVVVIGFLAALVWNGQPSSKAQVTTDTARDSMFENLIDSAKRNGTAHVIVALRAPFVPEGDLYRGQQDEQRREIKHAQSDLLARLPMSVRNVKQFDYIPYMAMEVDEAALGAMRSDSRVLAIEEDVIGRHALAESTGIVNATTAWASGYTGAGQTVAIVDSGVDKSHSFLAGRVVAEGCYSSNNASSTSVCPGGVTDSTAVDSGVHCSTTISGCNHGTHVAGIAAGRGTTVSGVAKDANIIAVQVFSRFASSTNCGSTPTPCALYWTSDLIKGLERVRTLKATNPTLAAVNLSLQTGQQFTSNCDAAHAATKAAVDNLRTLGVATVICAGNFSFTNALTAPACISTSISVGSTDDGSLGTTLNVVSNFSDSSPLLHLLAPGRWINSSVPGNAFSDFSGTSMATPHVVGAFAVLRQKAPGASVGRILKALTTTGQPITDSRNGIVKPRINIAAALDAVSRRTPADFDDDGKTDVGIYRPSVGEWWIYRSLSGTTFAAQFGAATNKAVPADYTGDGKADIAIFRPVTGEWFVLRSEDGTFFSGPFGASTDVPTPADFDDDGKADIAVFRPSTGFWFIRRSIDGVVTSQLFGLDGDVPVAGDYDGDGKADVAIYRPSAGQWWLSRSTAGVIAYGFGVATDKPVQGDYTGDGKTDAAFWRSSSGEWVILRSEDLSFFSAPFGATTDLPAPGDYDGDGKSDLAVFRPSTGFWFVNGTTGGTSAQQFGADGDRPLAGAYVP